jgi:hypothetical protein
MQPNKHTSFLFSTVILVILVFLPSGALGQTDYRMRGGGAPPLRFELVYFSRFLVHPGVGAGVEVTLFSKKRHEITIPTTIAYYVHPHNSRVVLANAGVGYLWHSKRVTFVMASLRAGYMHSFVDGDLYGERNGKIVELRDSGRPAFMPYFDLGVGVDPFKSKVHQFSPFLKVMTFGQYPYNGYMLPHFGWILGVSYHYDGKRRQP